MTNKFKIFSSGLVVGMVVLGSIAFTVNNEVPTALVKDGRVQQQWYPPELPKSMSFAGENVPLNQQPVKELLEKQLLINTYAHSHILYILKLSSRVFPVLEKKLKADGIPEDFKYMCVAESSLENPTSRAGATGYWQFMPATAKHYGLEVDSDVDERYDLDKATDAACTYIKDAYNKFGNWTAAAASYNCGMNGYARRADFQMTSNYYDLWLPEETNNYIFRILALKEIISHPEKYGFHIPGEDAYQPVATKDTTVSVTIPNLAAFAQANGTTYKMLHILNPWLRSQSLAVGTGSSYVIRLPL